MHFGKEFDGLKRKKMKLKSSTIYLGIVALIALILISLIKFSDLLAIQGNDRDKIQNCDNIGVYAIRVRLNNRKITLQFDNEQKSIYISKSQGFVIPTDSGKVVKTAGYKQISDTITYHHRSRYCNYINIIDDFTMEGNVFSSSESVDSFEVTFYFLKNNDPSNNFEKVAVENVFDNVKDFDKISPDFNKMLFELIDRKEFCSFFSLSQNNICDKRIKNE